MPGDKNDSHMVLTDADYQVLTEADVRMLELLANPPLDYSELHAHLDVDVAAELAED